MHIQVLFFKRERQVMRIGSINYNKGYIVSITKTINNSSIIKGSHKDYYSSGRQPRWGNRYPQIVPTSSGSLHIGCGTLNIVHISSGSLHTRIDVLNIFHICSSSLHTSIGTLNTIHISSIILHTSSNTHKPTHGGKCSHKTIQEII